MWVLRVVVLQTPAPPLTDPLVSGVCTVNSLIFVMVTPGFYNLF